MKRIIAFVAFAFMLNVAFATVTPSRKASEIFIPIGTTGQKISLLDLSSLKIKDVEQLTGKKMKFTDRLAFKVAQKKLRDNIASDGSLDTRKMEKAFKKQSKGGETGFHFGGFALGFFLGLIGVLIAYLIKDDYKQNRVKWAWIGTAIIVAINLIFLLA